MTTLEVYTGERAVGINNPRLYANLTPQGWDLIGAVCRDGYDRGALVRNAATGVYCQLNVNSLRSLDPDALREAMGH